MKRSLSDRPTGVRLRLALLTCTSLIACVATVAVVVQWVRSHRGGEIVARNMIVSVPRRSELTNLRAWSSSGTVHIVWNRELSVDTTAQMTNAKPRVIWRYIRHDGDPGGVYRAGDAPSWLVNLGLNWSSGSSRWASGPEIRSWWVQVHYAVLLAAILPADSLLIVVWWRIYRRRRRRKEERCAACGYDLRASPGRYPECGTEAPTGAVG